MFLCPVESVAALAVPWFVIKQGCCVRKYADFWLLKLHKENTVPPARGCI